jgi:hypothetical protein
LASSFHNKRNASEAAFLDILLREVQRDVTVEALEEAIQWRRSVVVAADTAKNGWDFVGGMLSHQSASVSAAVQQQLSDYRAFLSATGALEATGRGEKPGRRSSNKKRGGQGRSGPNDHQKRAGANSPSSPEA